MNTIWFLVIFTVTYGDLHIQNRPFQTYQDCVNASQYLRNEVRGYQNSVCTQAVLKWDKESK